MADTAAEAFALAKQSIVSAGTVLNQLKQSGELTDLDRAAAYQREAVYLMLEAVYRHLDEQENRTSASASTLLNAADMLSATFGGHDVDNLIRAMDNHATALREPPQFDD